MNWPVFILAFLILGMYVVPAITDRVQDRRQKRRAWSADKKKIEDVTRWWNARARGEA